MSPFDFRKALAEGLTDMSGFLLGALVGWWVGTLFGFDFIHGSGFGTQQIIGLAFILVAGGAGRWLARRMLERGTEKSG